MSPIHVVGFAGSLREKSLNRALLRAAVELVPHEMTLEVIDLAPLSLLNTDLESNGAPESVQPFRAALARADAFLIATPEYNWSISGVLKNAIDWASRSYPDDPSPLDGKPLAIMGAGGGLGTTRAQMHLREIVLHNDMHPLTRPALALARAWDYFDDELKLTDEDTRQRLRAVLEALAAWTRRLQGA